MDTVNIFLDNLMLHGACCSALNIEAVSGFPHSQREISKIHRDGKV